jgi:hypothetical protein
MRVVFDPALGQLRVRPGFALDQRGRAIAIGKDQCLDLVTFVEQNRLTLPMLAKVDTGVDLDLVVRAGACLERPVQAIAPECNGSDEDIAWSRLTEKAELALVAVTNDAPPADPLGTLIAAIEAGSYAPAAGDVEGTAIAALVAAAKLPGADPALGACIARQALLVASLSCPDPWPEPRAEECHVLLARLKGLRRVSGPAGLTVTITGIDTALRLLAPPAWAAIDRAPWQAAPEPVQGPRVQAASLAGQVISLSFDRPVAAASLVAGAFDLSDLSPTALVPATFVLAPTGPAAAPTGATLTLAGPSAGKLRLAAYGTGPHPIVDSDFLALGQRPGGDGQNFTRNF